MNESVNRLSGVRWIRFTAALLMLSVAPTVLAESAIKFGDTVEAHWGGSWRPAKVLEVSANGWVRVEVQDLTGRKYTPKLPPKKIRGQDAAAPGPKYKIGATVEAFWGEGWWKGKVVQQVGRGYRVKVDYKGRDRVLGVPESHVRFIGEKGKDDPHAHKKKNRVHSDELRNWKLSDGTVLPRASVENYIPRLRKVMLKKENNVTRFYLVDDLQPADRAYVLALAKKHGIEDKPIVKKPPPDFSGTFQGRIAPAPTDLGPNWGYAFGRKPRTYGKVTYSQTVDGKEVGRYMCSINTLTNATEAKRIFNIRREAAASKQPAASSYGDEGYMVRNSRGTDHFFRIDKVLIGVVTFKGSAQDQLCKVYSARTASILNEDKQN
ncbi:MAG: hypothetical protein OER86_08365 [Phycisphaerae bacterium]|nr:hypothetical protein [Phycisphaerae bacterium]